MHEKVVECGNSEIHKPGNQICTLLSLFGVCIPVGTVHWCSFSWPVWAELTSAQTPEPKETVISIF